MVERKIGKGGIILDRTVLHCDLNGFYAAVECVFNPELNKVPMAVAGNPKHRHGIILAKNELAKKFGVQTAETIWQAKKKCPALVLVPPRHGEYGRYSRLVNNIYEEFTDLVEPFGIDESWLDVTGVYKLFGSGPEIADKIRAAVKERLGLTISVGVSFNKVFAKLGSDYKKPDATTVITRENYKKIVWPLPVSALLFVGRAAKDSLARVGITTIGQLAAADRASMVKRLGKIGGTIHDYANGIDESPVRPAQETREIKSVGNGMTFSHDLKGFAEIENGVLALADEVASRMRRYGVKCRVVGVALKDPDFKSISRQKTLPAPTHLTREISGAAMQLIRACWQENAPLRSITVTGANLVGAECAAEQLAFFDDGIAGKEKLEKADLAVDKIRAKYGKNAIGFGAGQTGEENGEEE